MPASLTPAYCTASRTRASVYARGGKGTPPSISGTMVQGNLLTANVGTWIPSDSTVEYQWWRGKQTIPGETASTHTVTAEDMSLGNLRVTMLVTSVTLGPLPVSVRAPLVP